MSSDGTTTTEAPEVLLITAQQAAQLCQVSTDRVYEWSREPGFPVITGPHQVRIHYRLFLEWLEKRALDGREDAA